MGDLTIHPLTPDRWPDLEALFGKNGAAGGCWCMWWRSKPQTYKANKGDANRANLKSRVDDGHTTGLLAYSGDVPVGWVSFAPREDFERIPTSQTWRPIDDTLVWSIVCFFIRKGYRGQGMASQLLEAAVSHAASHGAQVIEAYPRDVDAAGNTPHHDTDMYFGTLTMFQRAGFREVARRNKIFPIVRLTLKA